MRVSILTISDSVAAGKYKDKSGPAVRERCKELGWEIACTAILKDDRNAIEAILQKLADAHESDLILTTGGTGLGPRDVTPEAVEPLFEKRMDGFSIAFHQISFGKIGSSTIQSRATAGTANSTFIFCLPGSPGACLDAWDEILVHQLDLRHRPCNFVEILSRLNEHLKRAKAKR